MAHRKAGGSAKSLRDSKPKYLGLKRGDGQYVKTGETLVRQIGVKILPGKNVGVSRNQTLYARSDGKVRFTKKRKNSFTGRTSVRSVVNVDTE